MLDVGRSELIALLGKGRFSKVYLKYCDSLVINAKPAEYCHIFALKIFDKNDVMSRGLVDKVMEEKKSLMLLCSRSNIYCTELIETYKSETEIGFVLAPILGGELSRHIALNGGFYERSVAIYAAEVVSAFTHMFRLGIIHRDVKSKNLLLDCSGHLKLCDFGSSKCLNVESLSIKDIDSSVYDYNSLPKAKTMLGTEYCLAPEISSADSYSFPVDWWGLGVLVWEMIAGKIPIFSWPLSTDMIVFNLQENGRIVCESTLDFIFQLLQMDPSMRLGVCSFHKVFSHSFFEGISWPDIHLGSFRVANSDFDQRIGYREVVDSFLIAKGKLIDQEIISNEQQQLFEGF